MNFKKIRWFGSLAISGIVVALALVFFIYPAVILCALIIDPQLRHSGESRFVPLWFESASHRYVSWSTAYLNSKYAESLQHYDVAATEWPMFGSVFFLVAAEDLHAQGKIDATQGVVRQAVDNAAAIVASPVTATWVRTKWGDDYLERENVFYRMLLILGLSSYESITRDTQYHLLMSTQRASLAEELLKAKLHMRDDYPDECYPNDVLWAVAAIQRAARLDQTNHNELAASLISVLDGSLQTPEKLPAFTVNARSGGIIQNARGCGNSGILMFASELDMNAALRWYGAYEEAFWKKTWWAVGFTELPRGSNLMFSDVDSGPVISEFGSVASAFGIGAAKTVGRFDHAAPLTLEAVASSWPTPFGPLLPGIMGYAAADSWCLGEVALLFSMTRPVRTTDTTPFTGSPPVLVWIALLIYAGIGTFFIGFEVRSCRRLNGKEP